MGSTGGAIEPGNFQYRCVLLIRIKLGQGPTMLEVGAGFGVVWLLFCRLSFLFFFLSLWSLNQPTAAKPEDVAMIEDITGAALLALVGIRAYL